MLFISKLLLSSQLHFLQEPHIPEATSAVVDFSDTELLEQMEKLESGSVEQLQEKEERIPVDALGGIVEAAMDHVQKKTSEVISRGNLKRFIANEINRRFRDRLEKNFEEFINEEILKRVLPVGNVSVDHILDSGEAFEEDADAEKRLADDGLFGLGLFTKEVVTIKPWERDLVSETSTLNRELFPEQDIETVKSTNKKFAINDEVNYQVDEVSGRSDEELEKAKVDKVNDADTGDEVGSTVKSNESSEFLPQ